MRSLPHSPLPRISHFLWGVASSADQHEGGYNGANQPQNNWTWAEQTGKVETSGPAADFWNLAPEDFSRCRALGLNAFRLSLSWSRIQPCLIAGPKEGIGGKTPPFDEAALHHYARIIADCRAAGLEPIVTLHHFTHPAWLGLDAWLEPGTIDHFLTFVEKTLRYLYEVLPRDFACPPPRYFITINEPNMLVSCHYLYGIFPTGWRRGLGPCFTALAHLLEAHVRAYTLIHRVAVEFQQKPLVTYNNYCSDLYWMDQAWTDLMFAAQWGVKREDLFTHLWAEAWEFDARFRRAELPIRPKLRHLCGQFLKQAHHFFAYICSFDQVWGRLVDELYRLPQAPLDYLAIDYYDPFVAHAIRWPRWNDQTWRQMNFHERILDGFASKWWDWKVLPDGLAFFVRSLERFRLPILIAENGMAERHVENAPHEGRRDRLKRSDYVRQHVRIIARLQKEGAPLLGYLYWSLVDNYEWGTYAPRFGLYSIDFPHSQERVALDPLGDNAAQAYAEEIALARQPDQSTEMTL